MRNYAEELEKRAEFVSDVLKRSGAMGIVFGNSGGKDSALVGIICKHACENTLGLIMPCSSKQNYGADIDDANALADKFGIECRMADLGAALAASKEAISEVTEISSAAAVNIAPRLRMLTLYAVAQSENRLVAGTGNRSEAFMGYFTKWGDGACDFNPIADLTVREIFEFLDFLGAPESIRKKIPSGGLFDGQTDEKEMGVTYAEIDDYLLNGKIPPPEIMAVMERYHARSEHKRKPIIKYK